MLQLVGQRGMAERGHRNLFHHLSSFNRANPLTARARRLAVQALQSGLCSPDLAVQTLQSGLGSSGFRGFLGKPSGPLNPGPQEGPCQHPYGAVSSSLLALFTDHLAGALRPANDQLSEK
jgi:hypothetical protein